MKTEKQIRAKYSKLKQRLNSQLLELDSDLYFDIQNILSTLDWVLDANQIILLGDEEEIPEVDENGYITVLS